MSGSGVRTQRPVVIAREAEYSGAPAAPAQASAFGGSRGIPLQMGTGRVPDGGHGANNMVKPKSIFEGNGSNPNLNNVRMQIGSAPAAPQAPQEIRRSVAIARPAMGQEDEAVQASVPPAPPGPPTNIQGVLLREGGPQGMTRKEAADMAAVLDASIAASTAALANGQTCIGVDGSSLDAAKEILTGMRRFGLVGNSSERLELRSAELDLIEKVIECGSNYQESKASQSSRTMAFIAGGLIIGVVVLLVTSK